MERIRQALGLTLAALALLAMFGCAGGEDAGPDLDPADMAQAMMDVLYTSLSPPDTCASCMPLCARKKDINHVCGLWH